MQETYKITASLINSYLYYKNGNKTEEDYNSFLNTLKNIYTENKWTKRGTLFEKEVYKNKHGKLSQLIVPLDKQVWCEKVITFSGMQIRIAGKLDALDKKNKIIYDIKRVDKFNEKKYSDEATVQHLFYFFLNPDITDFYYLVVSGKYNNIDGQYIVHKKRLDEPELQKSVFNIIGEFYNFLKDNDLFELYKDNWKLVDKSSNNSKILEEFK